jgi:similar to spore coat protein
MQGNKITPHETFVVHELLMSKSVCANKSAMMAPMVKDAELRGIIENTLNEDKKSIQELKGFISGSPLSNWQSSQAGGMNYANMTGSGINA